MTAWVDSILFVAWTAAVAVSDLRHRRVSNAWVAAGLVAAFACAFTARAPFGVDAEKAALGALAGLVALLPFYAFRVMGAADVKVFAVLGAWCGTQPLVALWIVASIAAFVHALATLVAARARSGDGGRARVLAVGMPRGAPFATFMTVPALAWLVLQWIAGGVR
jgi:prepilin peptidase CpaA